jgi:hypothetical protein
MSCEVPFSVLTSLPYNLPYGSSIYARVKVTNAYGTSTQSEAGNGAEILDVPAQSTIVNVPEGTNAQKFTVNWSVPLSDGGSPVIDYELHYMKPSESF